MFAVGLDETVIHSTLSLASITPIAHRVYSKDEIKQIVFGSLLGDAKLGMSERSVNARFGFIQSEIHAPYFLTFYSIFSEYCSSPYRTYSYLDIRTDKTYVSFSF